MKKRTKKRLIPVGGSSDSRAKRVKVFLLLFFQKKKAFLLLAPLAACTASSGIIAIGPDTYSVSELRAPAAGGGEAARQAVLADALAFCTHQGRSAVVVAQRPDGDPFTPYYPTGWDATFRCAPQTP